MKSIQSYSQFFLGPCTLTESKDAFNQGNKYESKSKHNFFGRFCTCDQFYLADDKEQSDMLQCQVCEDWFHENCLVGKVRDLYLGLVTDNNFYYRLHQWRFLKK